MIKERENILQIINKKCIRIQENYLMCYKNMLFRRRHYEIVHADTIYKNSHDIVPAFVAFAMMTHKQYGQRLWTWTLSDTVRAEIVRSTNLRV